MWERSFVAMSAALGEPWADVKAALGDAGVSRVKDLARVLDEGERQKKAEALARELGVVARDVVAMELAWR